MKKILTPALAAVLAVSLAACGIVADISASASPKSESSAHAAAENQG